MPLQRAAPSPLQFSDSLYRLVKEQSHRPPGYLFGRADEDQKLEHRGDFVQEVDPVCGICGAHGGHETAQVHDVRRTGGGRGER